MSAFDKIKKSVYNIIGIGFKESSIYMEYLLGLTLTHCLNCSQKNHKIYHKDNLPKLPEHENCACYLICLKATQPGSCTSLGKEGADYYLYYYKRLPDYYISKQEAQKLGWRAKSGNLWLVAQSKMIGGDIYHNREGKLPSAPGRIWYECDVEYAGIFRGQSRIVFSNDGLIFMTVDHYNSFIAIEEV